MKKLLQIDSCLGILSTGKITESIAALARDNGWDTYIAHGARAVGQTKQKHYQITTKTEEYVHYAYSVLFDSHGLHCTSATKKLIKWIDEIKPDIIHLHCIHGYHLNYKVLFDYINQLLPFYIELLTKKQQEIMTLYYYDNYSLSEIAEQLEISRNGVYDSLKKSEELIEKYESLLHLSTNCNKRMHYYTLLQSLENKQVNDIVKELIDLED